MESRHRKVGHVPTHTSAWNAGHRRRVARGGAWMAVAWMAVFRRGFLRRVDRPHAPRNLRFPAEEELVGKSHRRQGDLTAAAAVATKGSKRRIK